MQVGGSSVPGQTSCNTPEMLSLLKTPTNTCNNDRTRLIAIINDTSYPSDGLFKQMRGLAKVVTQRVPSWPCGLEIGTIVNEGGRESGRVVSPNTVYLAQVT